MFVLYTIKTSYEVTQTLKPSTWATIDTDCKHLLTHIPWISFDESFIGSQMSLRIKDTNWGSENGPKGNPNPKSKHFIYLFLIFWKKTGSILPMVEVIFCATKSIQTDPNKCIHINRRLKRIHSTRMYCKAGSLRCLTVTYYYRIVYIWFRRQYQVTCELSQL